MSEEKKQDAPVVQKSYVIIDDKLTMDDLLSGQTKTDFKVDTIVSGTIVEKRQDGALVDIGLKAEGFIPYTEFKNWEEVNVNDQIDVYLEELENEQNQPGISLPIGSTVALGMAVLIAIAELEVHLPHRS